MWHFVERGALDRYFDGHLGAGGEARMRRHLGACAACRTRYERQLAAEAALPDGARLTEDRGWRGIVAAAAVPAERVAGRRRIALPALSLAGAVAVALVAAPHLRRSAPPVERGGGDRAAPTLHVFRALPGGGSAPVASHVAPGDGLLFAYSNPGREAGWLMVFAVDESYRVFWYYPAYQHAGENPSAVAVRTDEHGFELGEEIRHQLQPGALRLFALFLAEPLDVLTVEESVRRTCQSHGLTLAACEHLPLTAVHQESRLLQVKP